ncbi:TIGR03943 family protein [Bacillus sp. FJAT-49711]|uniref:TIGR03943 family putative permease subunit n=1 Tax=Bacillus sp. FJAT-49711 TaxID=2833585 RepID=UPI001BCA4873|nr:TIGR03943 family protein [Bacillus sp. FJAT-49711]MBS4220252.1 TIGR03943 family protein [Bacillus sp. FJAT-49711]
MQTERDYSFHVYLRGIILIGFFLLIFKLLVTGNIQSFIAPKMVPFPYFSIVVLFILGIVQIWRSGSKNRDELYCNCGFDHNQKGSPLQTFFIYSIFVLPVFTGLLFPITTLDSSVAAKRGIKYGSGLYTQPPEINDDSSLDIEEAEEYLNDPVGYTEKLDERVETDPNDGLSESNEFETNEAGNDMLILTTEEQEKLKNKLLNEDKVIVDDDHYLAILNILHEDPSLFVGKEIEIIGFVYKEPDFNEDQFVVARFGVSCCIADASVYGIISTMDGFENIEEDQWVQATGKLSTTTMNDWELPFLQITNVKKMNEPENPYVYEYYTPLS